MSVTGRIHTGEWRPDADYRGVPGIKVTLRRARGYTDADVLKVPLRFQTPVTGDLQRHYSVPTSKFQTLRVGSRSRSIGPDLMTLQVSVILFDAAAADDASDNLIAWPHAPHPQRIIRELRWIMGKSPGANPQGNPFRLTLSQFALWPGEWLVNGVFKLTDFTATQKGDGGLGVEYLDLSFEEFDELDVDRKRIPDEKTQTYVFGETRPVGAGLRDLAQHYYHAPSLWRTIANANGVPVNGLDPDDGTALALWAARHGRKTLRIPPKPAKG